MDFSPSPTAAEPMTVLETGVYRGPHYYSHTPFVRIMLDLGALEDWPTSRIPDFTDRLLAALPGLERHGCSRKRRGGFVERLREGTWLGHVAEHVALELQSLAGTPVTRGKTRALPNRPGVYNVMFAYADDRIGRVAGRIALELVDALLPDELRGVRDLGRVYDLSGPFDLGRRVADMRRLVGRYNFGPTTQALVDEARRRSIPVLRLDHRSLIQLGTGRHQQRIRASITGRTSMVAVDIAGDKDQTKRLLDENGVPVPRGVVVRDVEEAVAEAKRLRYPLVTKPLDGNHGRGVTIGIANEEQLRFGYAEALAQSKGRDIIVEQFFTGSDHRILVIDNRLIAVAERVPAHVVGDGVRTIEQLIEEVNKDPRRGRGHEKVMTRISVDAHVREVLERDGLTVESVPEPGRRVVLRTTANLSTGGTAVDKTNEIHPDNAEIARRAAAIVGLDIAGIDFIAPDISKSVRETGGGIIELNAAPGFRMHLEPSVGAPRDVARPVIDMLFPRGSPSRVPIFAITGTNGKSTVGRMVKQVLRYTGANVGLTSTSGVYVNGLLVASGDSTGPRSARIVLRDPSVDIAVLETARGGMLREGLAFTDSDVGVVLNVTADHLGLKGIETLDDLAALKSLVVETVGRGGTSVLNADDPLCVRMARRAGGRLAWFSLQGGPDEMPLFLRRHVDEGGLAVAREPGQEGGTIVAYERGRREVVIEASAIPATLHGMATFNIANACATVAMCLAYKVPLLTIRSGMASFQSTFEQNPGRLNVNDEHGFRVILDYAHNAAGLTALGDVVRGLRHRYKRSLGVLSIPGDRREEDIVEMGRIAGGIFDELFFREDPNLRGRPRGEVMALLQRGALEGGALTEHIHLIPTEYGANAAGLLATNPGELLVITPNDVEDTWRQIERFERPESAAPASAAE